MTPTPHPTSWATFTTGAASGFLLAVAIVAIAGVFTPQLVGFGRDITVYDVDGVCLAQVPPECQVIGESRRGYQDRLASWCSVDFPSKLCPTVPDGAKLQDALDSK